MSVSPPDARSVSSRADANRNRQRILDAARTALDESAQTTMQAIARSAGVGQATLYRHFESREALLLEVYEHEFAELIDSAETFRDRSEPVVALRTWLTHLASFGRKKHALSAVLDAAAKRALHEKQYSSIIGVITTLLDDGKNAGQLRADIQADELLALVGFLWQLDTTTDTRITHLLDLVVDGLRAH
ncbi:TetR/AcrR family transcriptional regulator [Subtercola lobariae]|uniref:TetR family transcriptional regulator n=1 Tax=Subtercola lobariae TaxID=1588641 RepID=A0A917EUK8_9MICO|nr:TetR family transcriptional regulator [Subtercola lobariae]GGF15732.1 TetR family transcriptional regulator [Subtercola lobariae]